MKEDKFVGDEIDLVSLFAVLFDNLNFLISVFISSIFIILIYYFSATNIFQSSSLLEIKDENSSFLPSSLTRKLEGPVRGPSNSLEAEIEIYKSYETTLDALNNLKKDKKIFEDKSFTDELTFLTSDDIKSNLFIKAGSQSLIKIDFRSNNRELTRIILDKLNEEFISDRKSYIRQSSTAGKNFIKDEIPRVKNLLKISEDNLNNFKVSTNTSDVIFDTNRRNLNLERLKNRVNEIEFKELELKEFYKENHPIYLTLSEQKKLIVSQIAEIEDDLPNIPSTQRTLENFKREVEIYSSVLRELSSQELSLGMTEASSLSNVRIINNASEAIKISPRPIIFSLSLAAFFIAYIILLLRHFIGNKITNLDSLADFVGKDKIIGELPLIDNINDPKDKLFLNISEELLNKTIYEISHTFEEDKSIAIISSKKNVGKTEISKKIFEKLKTNYKVCLIDLDYRKKGLTQELSLKSDFTDFQSFNSEKENFLDSSGNLIIPSFEVDSPPDFFTSESFISEINRLKEEFDYVICDTPPWDLFVDSKIISKVFNNHIYIVCNHISTFKDIDAFLKEIHSSENVKFFFNKFTMYLKFFWYKYQYPLYSRNYYYDYMSYSSLRKNLTIRSYLLDSLSKLWDVAQKWALKLKNLFK